MRNGEKKTSEAIKELRQYLGLSLRLFGKPLGYSGTQIMRFENELTEPTDTVIEMICDAYGVDPRYFDGGVAIENAVQRVTKEENNRTVGKRLKLARNAKGLSMKELYYSSGVSDSQICLIENGENALTERTAEKLGQVLEVGVEWLLTGNEERKNFPLEGKLAEWLWRHPEVREELWEKVQQVLAEPKPVFANKNSHYLRGKVVCGNCGGYFMRTTRQKKSGKYKKWICKGQLASSGCKNLLIREEDLLARIEEQLGASDEAACEQIEKILVYPDGRFEIETK